MIANDSNILSIFCDVIQIRFDLASLCTEHRYCIPAEKKQGPGGYETLKHRLDATAKIMEYLGPMLPGWGEAEDNNTMGTHVFRVKK